MANFSLPALYVLPVGGSVPTSGTTKDLTPNQFGVFLPNYTPAAAGTSAAAAHLFLAQGRPNDDLNMRSRKGAKFNRSALVGSGYYTITGSATATQQITTITDFVARPGSQYNITLQLFSNMLDTSSRRGWVRSFPVNGPCIECGDDPCAPLTAEQTEQLVSDFVAKMNADKSLQGYVTIVADLDGLDSSITITGVAQTGLPLNDDLNANPYQLDAVTFNAFARVDAPTTMDYSLEDPCDVFATVTKTQNVSFPRGTYGEVYQKEKEYFSYTVPKFKDINSNPNYNPLFTSNAVPGTVYDQIVIRHRDIDNEEHWIDNVNTESTSIIYVPQAQTAAILAILTPALGTPASKNP